jgi:outer membrane cobalamin receptor
MTGAINVELAKPDTSEVYYLNTYTNSQGRFEVNQQGAHRFNSRLSTGLFTHYSQQVSRIDGNKDGFLDLPLFNLVNVLNRWKYATDRWMIQWGANYLHEDRLGGQNGIESNSDRYKIYGFGSKTERLETFAKIARLYPQKPYQGLALILSTANHSNDSYFAMKNYRGREQSVYGNFIFQSIIGNTNHTWKTGASFLMDSYQESYIDSAYARTEIVPGIYGEYTWTIPNALTVVVGQRIDFHNQLGTQWVPRLHVKWDVAPDWIVRLSAGKGWRRVNPLAENMGFLINNRALTLVGDLNPLEVSWNYGITLTKNMNIGSRKANLVLDAFQTDFTQQWMVDMEAGSRLRMYAMPGVSYSTSIQGEFNYSPFKRFEMKVAYRYQDVQADYLQMDGGLIRLTKPYLNKDRVLVNLSYATPYEIWKYDVTWQWNGSRRIPDHKLSHLHTGAIQEVTAPPFSTVYAQVTRQFKKWELYVGAENLFNFTQNNPIYVAKDPFAKGFDASMVWGPIVGTMVYSGIRYKIN